MSIIRSITAKRSSPTGLLMKTVLVRFKWIRIRLIIVYEVGWKNNGKYSYLKN